MTETALRITSRPGIKPRCLVAILHGYGADKDDLFPLAERLSSSLPDCAFFIPDAPEHLPFAAVSGRQWFALQERTPREIAQGTEASAPALLRILEAELAALHLGWKDLILIGFSQGSMMALEVGLRQMPYAPAAIVSLSGRLPAPDKPETLRHAPPILMVHGANDDVVEPYHLGAAESVLQHHDIPVETHLLKDLGHGINDETIRLCAEFLET